MQRANDHRIIKFPPVTLRPASTANSKYREAFSVADSEYRIDETIQLLNIWCFHIGRSWRRQDTDSYILYSTIVHALCSMERKAIISSTIFILKRFAGDKIGCTRARIYIRRKQLLASGSSLNKIPPIRFTTVHSNFGLRSRFSSRRSAWNDAGRLVAKSSDPTAWRTTLKFEFRV